MPNPDTSAARPVDLLRGVLHGARHAARLAKEGRMAEASEHVAAIERLTAAYWDRVKGTEQEDVA